ncbi:MAG: murein transglycosylase A [Campylobacterales bacterium]|nr:murein transglycosylase A [Campylobacterales bacterium]
MKLILSICLFLLFFYGCAKKPERKLQTAPQTVLVKESFNELKNWKNENYTEVLSLFQQSCTSSKVQKIYPKSCQKAQEVVDAKAFLETEFSPYQIKSDAGAEFGLLTGYYEPFLRASFEKSEAYPYPIYKKPKDLVTVELSSIYPELKHYRLRGRLEGDRLVPYYTRAKSKESGLDAEVLCYTDSKIDRFFLEIQGSGRVLLDDNSSMYIGFENQNGHKYRAIGKYLVQIGALKLEEVSLQTIREWLEANPSRLDEVLNYNASMVFFGQREQGATGALGIELTPKRSVAIDRRFIPLGSMLYLDAQTHSGEISNVVFAQDTGGAIKGSVRADLFLGSGEDALEIAGRLKAPLNLWILLPNEEQEI